MDQHDATPPPDQAAPVPAAPADPAPAPAAPSPVAPAPAAKPAAAPAAAKPAGAAPAKPAAKPEPKAPAPPPLPPDPPPGPDVVRPAWLGEFEAAFPGVAQLSHFVGDWTVIVPAGRLVEVATWLRDAPGACFDYCADVTAVDWPSRADRFDLVYCLYSVPLRHRVRVKVRAGEADAVPSATGVWPAANWLEREIFDMFGVRFTGHPDLRRLLMPDEWQGHPQRKDYPLEGPGELMVEDPQEWLELRNAAREAEFE
jgi:NADH-quinone oxidoreductase subunit C